jgi:hypothetical protein
MAENTVVLTFTWENSSELKLIANENDGGDKTIIEMEENGNIGRLWDEGIKSALTKYIDELLDEIGSDMKA